MLDCGEGTPGDENGGLISAFTPGDESGGLIGKESGVANKEL